jgi:hypothetical protein
MNRFDSILQLTLQNNKIILGSAQCSKKIGDVPINMAPSKKIVEAHP